MTYPNLETMLVEVVKYLGTVRVATTLSIHAKTIMLNNPEDDKNAGVDVLSYCLHKMKDLEYIDKLTDGDGNDCWYLNDCWHLIAPIEQERREVDCPNCGTCFNLDK